VPRRNILHWWKLGCNRMSSWYIFNRSSKYRFV